MVNKITETLCARSCASKLARDSRLESFAEGRPNVLDIILNKQVNLIINTPWAKRDAIKDESAIRKAAIKSVQNECRRKKLALALFFYDRVQPRTLYETCHFSGLVELSSLGRSIKYKVPYITTLAGAYNTVKGIAAVRNGHGAVKSLQEYHATIEEV